MKSIFVLFSLFAFASAVYGKNAIEEAVQKAAARAVDDIQNGVAIVDGIESAVHSIYKLALEYAESLGNSADPSLRAKLAYVSAVAGGLRAATQALISLTSGNKQASIEILNQIEEVNAVIIQKAQQVLENLSEGDLPEGFAYELEKIAEDLHTDLYVFLSILVDELFNGNPTPAKLAPTVTLATAYLARFIQLTSYAF